VRERYPALDDVRVGHELMRRQITIMVEDVIRAATENLARLRPESAEAVRAAGETIVTFTPAMAVEEKELKAFLYKHLYRHPEVMRVRVNAEKIVCDLFDVYFSDPRAMPEGWREGLDRAEDRIKARHVADFLAGMTDTYAVKEHRRLFDHTPDLS
jgi:dGTPase